VELNIKTMRMKKLTTLFIACLIGTSIFAGGNTGIGLRISSFGLGSGGTETIFGITLNHHFSRGTTLEGIADFPTGGVIISGLYEKFHSLNRSGNFCFFYGGGIFIGSGGGTTIAGLRGVLGLNYEFKDLPIELSIDWMPALEIVNDVQAGLKCLGLSARFTF
jgi:hypothetical protein